MVDDNNKTTMRVDDNPIGDLIEKGEETVKDVEEVVHAIETGGIDAAVDTLEKEPIVKNNPVADDVVKSLGECGKIFNALKSQDYGAAITSVTQLASIVSQIPGHFEDFKGEKLPHIEKEAEEIKETGKKLVDNIKEQGEEFVHDIKSIHSFGDFINMVVNVVDGIKEDIGLGKDVLENVNDLTDVITKNANDLKEAGTKDASKDPIMAAAQGLSGATVENASTPGGAPHTPSDPGQGQDQGGPAVGG